MLAFQGRVPELYYWRTNYGAEVDVVLRHGEKLIPIEIKCHSQPNREMLGGLDTFRTSFPEQTSMAHVISLAREPYPLDASAEVLPLRGLPHLIMEVLRRSRNVFPTRDARRPGRERP